jgi:hypothetical protein
MSGSIAWHDHATVSNSREVLTPQPGRLYHITYGEEEEKENDGVGGGTYRYHAIHPPVVEERGESAAKPPTDSQANIRIFLGMTGFYTGNGLIIMLQWHCH